LSPTIKAERVRYIKLGRDSGYDKTARRQGIVGKNQKTIDLDLYLPSTGERAFVQVKSKTSSVELADYVRGLDELDSFDRMFFVYHSEKAETDDERVIVIRPEKLAEMAVDAGLATWLIRKVS